MSTNHDDSLCVDTMSCDVDAGVTTESSDVVDTLLETKDISDTLPGPTNSEDHDNSSVESIEMAVETKDDPLRGQVSRQLSMGQMQTTGRGVPEHIRKLAEENPGQVTIMEWAPTKVFDALDARDVASYVKYIQKEFVALLHTTKNGVCDDELRTRMCCHPPIANFANKYEKVFTSITTREIATNPQLMTPILFQVYLLQETQSGRLSDDQARSMVANSAMEALLKEGMRKGVISAEDVQKAKSQQHQT